MLRAALIHGGVVVAGLSLWLGAAGAAETSPPATTAPTPQAAATTQADDGAEGMLKTPVGALTLQYMALARGDAATLARVYRTQTPQDQELAKAYVGLGEAIGRLRDASVAKWGPDGFTQMGLSDSITREVARIASAREEHPSEDSVKLYAGGDKAPPVVLRRNEQGQWQMALGEMFAKPDEQAMRVEAQAAAYTELAGEIAAGKYEHAIDARQARHRKVSEAVRKAANGEK